MKIPLITILICGITSGNLFAQDRLDSISNEGALQNAKIQKGIKFVNKNINDNVAFSHLVANGEFSFEGHYPNPSASKELTLEDCSFNTSHFLGPYFQTITFENCSFNAGPIFRSPADTLQSYIYDADFEDCTFSDGLDFSDVTIGDGLTIAGNMSGQLDLSGVRVDKPSAKIDLMRLFPNHSAGINTDIDGKISIDLKDASVANIVMDYQQFKLDTSNLSCEEVTGLYTALLANFKTRGFDESYESADVEYQQYKYHNNNTLLGCIFLPLIDVLQHYWWYYGYEKFRILVITPLLLLIFTVINLFFYKRLNEEAYTVSDEEIADQNVSFYNSLVYTAVIFFSFTLKLENLHFKSRQLSLWLIFIYITGVICMAFLANYVLKSGAIS